VALQAKEGQMAMVETDSGWRLDVDRGPDWLFVRVHPPESDDLEAPDLAETIWHILQQHFANRVVLEMERIALLRSYLIGQLILLGKRVHSHGGLLRLCGLSEDNCKVLRSCRLESALPNFATRSEAVMGRPRQPR
jgi:anti-anti-sigma regulatory factor